MRGPRYRALGALEATTTKRDCLAWSIIPFALGIFPFSGAKCSEGLETFCSNLTGGRN